MVWVCHRHGRRRFQRSTTIRPAVVEADLACYWLTEHAPVAQKYVEMPEEIALRTLAFLTASDSRRNTEDFYRRS